MHCLSDGDPPVRMARHQIGRKQYMDRPIAVYMGNGVERDDGGGYDAHIRAVFIY